MSRSVILVAKAKISESIKETNDSNQGHKCTHVFKSKLSLKKNVKNDEFFLGVKRIN